MTYDGWTPVGRPMEGGERVTKHNDMLRAAFWLLMAIQTRQSQVWRPPRMGGHLRNQGTDKIKGSWIVHATPKEKLKHTIYIRTWDPPPNNLILREARTYDIATTGSMIDKATRQATPNVDKEHDGNVLCKPDWIPNMKQKFGVKIGQIKTSQAM